jgi:hypothetical protein
VDTGQNVMDDVLSGLEDNYLTVAALADIFSAMVTEAMPRGVD